MNLSWHNIQFPEIPVSCRRKKTSSSLAHSVHLHWRRLHSILLTEGRSSEVTRLVKAPFMCWSKSYTVYRLSGESHLRGSTTHIPTTLSYSSAVPFRSSKSSKSCPQNPRSQFRVTKIIPFPCSSDISRTQVFEQKTISAYPVSKTAKTHPKFESNHLKRFIVILSWQFSNFTW